MIVNALTIDVEDYFQVQAFSEVIRYEDWGNYESRVERNTRRILELLTDPSSSVSSNPDLQTSNLELGTLNVEPRTSVRATFFCLGWIAERFPQLIREIHLRGHEIACHGYAHQLIYRQSKEEFKEDIHKAKTILEDITGCEVIGYRAPSYSITNQSKWAFEVLAEEGFQYDSSIFPIRHDFYGMPDAPRFPFLVSLNGNASPEFKPFNSVFLSEKEILSAPNSEPGTRNSEPATPNPNNSSNPITSINSSNPGNPYSIIEFPISTVRLMNINLPLSGGGYFRLFPYSLTRRGLRRLNEQEGQSFIFYLHPWELDPDQPRVRGASPKSKFRHYLSLNKTERRFRCLLRDFKFSPIKNILFQTDKIDQNTRWIR